MKSFTIQFLVISLIVTGTVVTRAADGGAAKVLFGEGTELYSDGAYDEAAKKFKAAYALKPSWKLLYNIGQAEAASKRQGLAIEAFEKYLAEGGDEVPADRREQVYAEIDKLRRIVGSISITAPEGKRVVIDGVERGVTPLSGRLRISASVEHTVELWEGESVLDTKKVTVAGQETIDVALTDGRSTSPAPAAVAAASASGEPAVPVDPEAQKLHKLNRQAKSLWIAGWITAGVGAASLVGAGIAGGLALRMDEDFDPNGLCDANGVCPPSLEEDLQKRDAMALYSSMLFIVGGAALVTGSVLLIVSRKKKSRAESMNVAVTPVFAGNQGGLFLSGSF